MALNAYLRMEGQKQGPIKGSVTLKGREDSIMVIAFNHEVLSPRDIVSGLPTGMRQHKMLTITKEIDKATPLLMNALVTNEKLKKFELRFWRPSSSGAPSGIGMEKQFFTIQLINANVADIKMEMLDNVYPENVVHKEREHISFTYQKIIWTYEEGGITSTDDWDSSRI
ncbi:MAG: type VI secretion system tube protein Hcp [Chlorobium sp.]|nr:MAG: type VI secretion system tube protein Hcp [Chlorobium sp.]